MYQPPYHAQTDLGALQGLIEANPLGVLFTSGAGAPVADHLPFVLDRQAGPNGTLLAHVARANPVWRAWAAGQPCLVVFQAAAHYITPNWYPTKDEGGRVVPTWNYRAVHATGTPRLVSEPSRVVELLARLTNQSEAGQARPWRLDDAPPDFIEQLARAVVAFEIPIDQLIGRWKLSQDETSPDRHGTAQGLQALHTPAADELAREIALTLS